MQLKDAITLTSPGSRSHNEDAALFLEGVPLLAVVDGMGGKGVGDVAADIAVTCLRNNASFFHTEVAQQSGGPQQKRRIGQLLESSFQWAHMEISRSHRRVGAAMIAAVIAGGRATIGHVGNCRAWVLRGGRLIQLTEDHTVAQACRAAGRTVQPSDERRLLQILGSGSPDVDIAEIPLAEDDVLLLATDGITAVLSADQIEGLIDIDDLEASAARLIAAASDGDNVTVALARIRADRDVPSIDAITHHMHRVFLFRDLSSAERYLFAPYLEERSLKAGEILVAEGEPGDAFFVVLAGTLEVTRGGVHLIDIEAGEHLGELTLVRPAPRSATVTAVTDARVYRLSRARFQEAVKRRPGLGVRLSMALLDTVGTRLRDLTDRLATAEIVLQQADLPSADVAHVLAALRGDSVR
ncbi:MAG: serine/threonine protein phosphatase PrpC/CRP-like cAMP-binding protein [Myxococcota bacterium]|jgi:serine/threonine protein phosphatase PrpC/CRP-like cAMP-binding protein